jgi:phosphohistidine phosphatase
MKNLTLVRHAKSSWETGVKDFDRDLLQIGIEKAIKCANAIHSEINLNALIWSSPAKRAYKTAQIFTNCWNFHPERIQLIDDLYAFDLIQFEEIVKSCPNHSDTLILFGHNSAITDFVNKFGTVFIDNVPTSGLVSINFETGNWRKIEKGHTIKTLFPRTILL